MFGMSLSQYRVAIVAMAMLLIVLVVTAFMALSMHTLQAGDSWTKKTAVVVAGDSWTYVGVNVDGDSWT